MHDNGPKQWTPIFILYDGNTRYGSLKFRLWLDQKLTRSFDPTDEAHLAEFNKAIDEWLLARDAAGMDAKRHPASVGADTTHRDLLADSPEELHEDTKLPF